MSEIKRLKDPLYGYISIPAEISKKIIDTAAFQRLRRIIQTSYSPLYASAIHNRFVHSLGVFHLGQLAVKTISEQIKIKNIEIHSFDRITDIFLLACLLHDIGHAPFSHTDEFSKDIPQNDRNSAAPHEVMSVIIGIQSFEDISYFEISRNGMRNICEGIYIRPYSLPANDIKISTENPSTRLKQVIAPSIFSIRQREMYKPSPEPSDFLACRVLR